MFRSSLGIEWRRRGVSGFSLQGQGFSPKTRSSVRQENSEPAVGCSLRAPFPLSPPVLQVLSFSGFSQISRRWTGVLLRRVFSFVQFVQNGPTERKLRLQPSSDSGLRQDSGKCRTSRRSGRMRDRWRIAKEIGHRDTPQTNRTKIFLRRFPPFELQFASNYLENVNLAV